MLVLVQVQRHQIAAISWTLKGKIWKNILSIPPSHEAFPRSLGVSVSVPQCPSISTVSVLWLRWDVGIACPPQQVFGILLSTSVELTNIILVNYPKPGISI